MDELILAVGDDRWFPAQQDVEDDATAPHIGFGWGRLSDCLRRGEDYPTDALIDDLLNAEYLGDTEVLHLDNVLPLGVEEDTGELEICMCNASLVAVAQKCQQLPYDWRSGILFKVLLILEHSGKRLSVAVFDDYEKSMIILEQLVYLWDCRVINLLESADLLFKEFALMTAYLVLIDNINRTY